MNKPIEKIDLEKLAELSSIDRIANLADKFNQVIDSLTTMNEKGGEKHCCEKCHIYLDYKDAHQCSDNMCECHTPPHQSWEKEFDKIWENNPKSKLLFYNKIESFISSLLLSQKEELVERIGKLEKYPGKPTGILVFLSDVIDEIKK